MNVPIPVFTLYGLVGCHHCAEAESYLRIRNIPFLLFIANDDVVADEGIKRFTGGEQSEYPVLVCKIPGNKEVVIGFKRDDYDRLANTYYAFFGASAVSVFGSQQQPVAQDS